MITIKFISGDQKRIKADSNTLFWQALIRLWNGSKT